MHRNWVYRDSMNALSIGRYSLARSHSLGIAIESGYPKNCLVFEIRISVQNDRDREHCCGMMLEFEPIHSKCNETRDLNDGSFFSHFKLFGLLCFL